MFDMATRSHNGADIRGRRIDFLRVASRQNGSLPTRICHLQITARRIVDTDLFYRCLCYSKRFFWTVEKCRV